VDDLSIGIQYPCFQPFLNPLQKRLVINAPFQQIQQLGVVDTALLR
jgi:hypothetical protein